MVLGIYGAGGQGREIYLLAKKINIEKQCWDKIIFIDDAGDMNVVQDTEVITFHTMCSRYDKDKIEIVIAVGEPALRYLLRNKLQKEGYRLATLIHPSADVAKDAIIKTGAIICYNSFISCNVTVSENVLIQPFVYIGHDSQIGHDTVVSAHACIAGRCSIGSETYIGLHVPIRENVVVGNSSIIGMGSVVVRDISDHIVAFGNPARTVRNNIDHKVFH